MHPPTPELIKSTRKKAKLTQTQAGALIGKALKTWQNWECAPGKVSHRKMNSAYWELFLLKLAEKA